MKNKKNIFLFILIFAVFTSLQVEASVENSYVGVYFEESSPNGKNEITPILINEVRPVNEKLPLTGEKNLSISYIIPVLLNFSIIFIIYKDKRSFLRWLQKKFF